MVQSLSTELTPISFEEHPDFGRSDGGGGEYGKTKKDNSWASSGIEIDWIISETSGDSIERIAKPAIYYQLSINSYVSITQFLCVF